LAALQDELKRALYRRSCPSPAGLRDYHFDLLDAPATQAITRHLQACPHCTREVLEDYGDTQAPAADRGPGLGDRLRLLLANLVDSVAGGPAPALALRDRSPGSPPPQHLTYAADGLTLTLTLLPADDSPEMILEGEVAGEVDLAAQAFQVHLWRDERLVALIPLDEVGDFSVRLPPAAYTLILSGPAQKIMFPVLSIGPPEE
jgi:hypothetical protein